MRKALLLLLMMPTMAMAQIITTIAGTGVVGYSGDGGGATAANLNQPTGPVMDAAGNIYISDAANNRIRKINTSGIITTVAGNGTAGYSGDGGPATAAQLNDPGNLVVDLAGNIYFPDLNNERVRKINPTGTITTIAGNGIAGFSGDGGPATAASLGRPVSVCFDPSGNLLLADLYNDRIRKITPSGIITTIAGNGVIGFSGDGGAATSASFAAPIGVYADAVNNIYVADNGNHRVRKINPSGIISTYAGNGTAGYSGDGGAATSAQIQFPRGIVLDGAGNLYIADFYNNRVRKVTASGIISTICGTGTPGFSGDGGPATAAEIYKVVDLKLTNSGDLIIADYGNNRIRKIAIGTVVPTNQIPTFTGGASDTLEYCRSEVPILISSLLSISDADLGQTETWSLETAPLHGIANVAYTAVSIGGTITPVGLTYSAASGYSGADMFRVKIKDGIDSSVITINVIINPLPNAGAISGIDSVCPGATVTLSETATGGFWSETNALIATVSGSGVVTGIAPGTDTIVYTVINSCGVSSAIFTMYVRSYAACHTGIDILAKGISGIGLYPNPASAELNVISTEMINRIVISSVTGQTVIIRACATDHEVVDISGLASGVYLIKINGSEVRNFVKQ